MDQTGTLVNVGESKNLNILFYGNCQLYACIKTLNLDNNYNIFHISCWNCEKNKQYFTDIIIKCDVIITQYIGDGYRDVEYLSTSYIIQHKTPNCKLIIFDSCYFNFYYFDLTTTIFKDDHLHKPCDYHYNNMMECYTDGKPIDDYINQFVNNLDLKSSEELETFANKSLDNMHDRHIQNERKYADNNIYHISICEYIKQNYKDKLLFYSMNHPTKYVIQMICEKIVDILQIQNTINYDIDILNHTKCILYKCISKNVKFDINAHNALLLNHTDINKITQLYYDTYTEIGFK